MPPQQKAQTLAEEKGFACPWQPGHPALNLKFIDKGYLVMA
jgi:hypothetical protein